MAGETTPGGGKLDGLSDARGHTCQYQCEWEREAPRTVQRGMSDIAATCKECSVRYLYSILLWSRGRSIQQLFAITMQEKERVPRYSQQL